MSKLKELIDKYCPNGVEYKPLGDKDVSIMQRGTSLTKKDSIEGVYPVISGGKTPAFYCDISNRSGETITVAGSGAGAGYVQYWNEPIFVCDAFSIKGVGNVSTKYLYYCLVNMQDEIYATKKGGGVPHVHISSIDKFLIPIPPLPVQDEIVKILDRFAEYAAELQAELQARQEQYEYYRNKLLTFNDIMGGGEQRIIWMRMSEICINICSGGTPSTSKREYFQGNIPWLRTQEVDWKDVYDTSIKISEDAVINSSAKLIPANCVIIAMYGATAGKSCINKIPLTTNQACCNLQVNEEIATYKYVFHWLCREYKNLKALGEGTQSNISGKKIKSFKIPVPPIAEQYRIVSILDRFETLVSNLSQGLPAEINAVQEQYEYYRNKLLSFPKYNLSA